VKISDEIRSLADRYRVIERQKRQTKDYKSYSKLVREQVQLRDEMTKKRNTILFR